MHLIVVMSLGARWVHVGSGGLYNRLSPTCCYDKRMADEKHPEHLACFQANFVKDSLLIEKEGVYVADRER